MVEASEITFETSFMRLFETGLVFFLYLDESNRSTYHTSDHGSNLFGFCWAVEVELAILGFES